MLGDEVLLRTKLTPPGLQRRLLPRPALAAKLREALDYRLTLVQAATGYGKSTALAAWAEDDASLRMAWYSVDEADTDPQRFLSYLIAAFRAQLPDLPDAPLAVLQELSSVSGPRTWTQALDSLINALAATLDRPLLLVIDDYDFVAGSGEISALTERLITYLPADLHVILARRQPFHFVGLVEWRAKARVLEIGREDLAFQPAEIEALFRDVYGTQLSADEIAALADKTEGWPITLRLVWQSLRDGTAHNVADLLAKGPASLGALFDYLARDVLDRQPPDMADFIRATAVLRRLSPAACDAVTGSSNGTAMLNRLHDLDLFVVALGDHNYRYHHLFSDVLRELLAADPAREKERHRRAARFFRQQDNAEEAIYHWFSADEPSEAAHDIEVAGEAALRDGRLDTVAAWIDSLPAETLAERPLLQRCLGDVYRLRSRFSEALAWYQEAERTWRARQDPDGISRALRGQAMVYLDTVRPAQAESLLEEALRFTDGLADREARARLLELLAENKLNMGKPVEAEALHAEARALREEGPGEDVLGVRVKIRTGQLDAAQRILEDWAESERSYVEHEHAYAHPPRMHRETVLLLSLIHSFRGTADRAFALAQEGIALGEERNSPFVTTVGHLRLGHAWQLLTQPGAGRAGSQRDEAIRCYQTAIALGDRIAVRRTRAEGMWGLARAYGFYGDLESAERAAAEGIEISRWAGDPWMVALIDLTLGGGYVLADRPSKAIDRLSRALIAFRDCGDTFGRAASRLWLGLAYLDLKQVERLLPCVEEAMALCEAHAYDFLFTAPATLLGPPDPRRLVPLLVEARDHGYRPAYADRLLGTIGLPDVEVHPGYQLRVGTLGGFRVWRGTVEIGLREWQRDKARQLFQLFLTRRDRWLQREEIVNDLWPDLSPAAANRDFKVALNALNKAIEPERSSDAPFAFIIREGSAYRLRPEADVWLDSVRFERACEDGLRLAERGRADEALAQLQEAVALYEGDYLPDALYEDWTTEARERLLSLYLRAADKLAATLIDRGRLDESLDVCQAILARDACWENAYRLMMIAYERQGNRPQALRAYQRCVHVLRDELGVAPSPATMALHESIVQVGDAPVTGA